MVQIRAKASGASKSDPYTAKASGAEIVSTTGAAVSIQDGASLYVEVVVTAVSGTGPTMTVVVEGSNDGGTTWFTIGTIGANGASLGGAGSAPTNITANGTYRGCLPAMPLVRSRSVVAGTTPSFTYAVNIEAMG